MGLLDILNGMQNGPRGQSMPSSTSGSAGMSPLAIALMGLLAYKAFKHFNPGQSNDAATLPSAPNSNGTSGGLGGLLQGGLGSLLQSPLGKLIGGSAAGSVLSNGLNDLLKQFQQKGQGEVAKSWIDTGPNKEITPSQLSKVLDEDQIRTLMAHSGMSRDELIAGLTQQLPEFIDRLTPQGRIPTEQEAARLV